MHTPVYTPPFEVGQRVHHVNVTWVHGTVTEVCFTTIRVLWDNRVDAWQSISVLRAVDPETRNPTV